MSTTGKGRALPASPDFNSSGKDGIATQEKSRKCPWKKRKGKAKKIL
jgi:hypothetical protein